MTSVKRMRVKPKWGPIIIAGILFSLVLIVISWGFFSLMNFLDQDNALYCPRGSKNIAATVVGSEFKDVEHIGDYLYFGESLILTPSTYQGYDVANSYVDYTVQFVNLCSKRNYDLIVNSKLNEYLNISSLPVGLYEIYLIEGSTKYRMSADSEILMEMYSVTRDKNNKLISLIANKNYFKDIKADYQLKDYYLFLNVKTQKLPVDVYDVVVDPQYVDKGDPTYSSDIFTNSKGADELFAIATALTNELRTAGYKVLLTRTAADEALASYGVEGRIYRSVKANAKYYLGLSMVDGDLKSGSNIKISYSSYASNAFSKAVVEEFTKNKKLNLSSEPLVVSGRIRGYDSIIDLREIGGLALMAGSYSDFTKRENGAFAGGRFGIEGISITLANANDEAGLVDLKADSKAIVKDIVNGFTSYLK